MREAPDRDLHFINDDSPGKSTENVFIAIQFYLSVRGEY